MTKPRPTPKPPAPDVAERDAEIARLRERNAQLSTQLLRAEVELERIKSLADLERINPIRYRSE